MKINDAGSLQYELGVLMFNTCSESEHALFINNNYDGVGNFVSLINAFDNVDLNDLKEGFTAECQNYSLNQIETLFEETKTLIENYNG